MLRRVKNASVVAEVANESQVPDLELDPETRDQLHNPKAVSAEAVETF